MTPCRSRRPCWNVRDLGGLPTADGGTSVRYQAEFLMKGWARIIGPLLTPAFARLGRKGATQMHEALDRLGAVG